MPDLRARVTVSQRAEGRVVELTLTREAVEELLNRGHVEHREGDDDCEFEDETAAGDDMDNPPGVVGVELTIVDDFSIGG